jgi:hypothetical protein
VPSERHGQATPETTRPAGRTNSNGDGKVRADQDANVKRFTAAQRVIITLPWPENESHPAWAEVRALHITADQCRGVKDAVLSTYSSLGRSSIDYQAEESTKDILIRR